MPPSATPERKNRLSNIFGNKKSKENELRPTLTDEDERPSNDSAYASSETRSRTSPDNRNAVPIEDNGSMGVDKNRNLAVNQKGEVIDQDSGETVTVVTTTTTTTTTVTKGKNGEQQSTVRVESRPGEPNAGGQTGPNTLHQVAEAPGDGPANRFQPGAEHSRSRPEETRTPLPQYQQRPPADGPPIPIPARSANRKSREYGEPVSPQNYKHNFSYPSRSQTDLRSQAVMGEENGYQEYQHAPQQYDNHRVSAMQNLKAAAVGLHGVGETLRGTLNSEIDGRLPRRNPEKAAATNAKNQEDLARGEREMARLREARGLQPTTLQPTKSQEAGYRLDSQPDGVHPAYRHPSQQHPSSLQPGRQPPPQEGRYPQPMQQQPPSPQPNGFNKVEADRYQQHKRPMDKLRRDPAEQAGRSDGYAGPSGGGGAQQNGVGNVQALSQGTGRAEEEKEEKRGLRKLFKR